MDTTHTFIAFLHTRQGPTTSSPCPRFFVTSRIHPFFSLKTGLGDSGDFSCFWLLVLLWSLVSVFCSNPDSRPFEFGLTYGISNVKYDPVVWRYVDLFKNVLRLFYKTETDVWTQGNIHNMHKIPTMTK